MHSIVMMALLHGVASPSPVVAMTHARPIMVLTALLDESPTEATSIVEGPMLQVVSDTSVLAPSADTFLRLVAPNQNRGHLDRMWIRGTGGKSRGLIRWAQGAISQAVGPGVLLSATLEMPIDTAFDWGSSGRYVGVFRLSQDWTELASTFNCADDIDTSNNVADCSGTTAWIMGDPPSDRPWGPPPSDSVLISGGQTGTVLFDVTADVEDFLAGDDNFGWLVTKLDETRSGKVRFATREASGPPQLQLLVQSDTTRPAVPALPATFPDSSLTVDDPNSEAIYYRTLLAIAFDDSTSGSSVNATLAAANATIVGGIAPGTSSEAYYVTIPDQVSTLDQLDSLIATITDRSGVRSVRRIPFRPRRHLRGRFPQDGFNTRRVDWFSLTDATRSLVAIRAPHAWGCETGAYDAARVLVGVVDITFDFNHPDLDTSGVIIKVPRSTDIANYQIGNLMGPAGDSIAGAVRGHGTAVAGVLAAGTDNDVGVAGMLWDHTLRYYMLGRTLPNIGIAEYKDPTAAFVDMMNDAANAGVRVLTLPMSWEDPTNLNVVRELVLGMLTYLNSGGILVYAVGQDSSGAQGFRVARQEVRDGDVRFDATDRAIALLMDSTSLRDQIFVVAGSDVNNGFWTPSHYWTDAVDVVAPAENIELLAHTIDAPIQNPPGLGFQLGGVARSSGTSFAAPYVAGAAALLLSFNPSLTAADVKRLIIDGARSQRRDSTTGLLVDRMPVSGAPEEVFLLDIYGSLRMASDEVANSPICGYEVRLEDNQIVFEKPSGQIVKPFPGPGQSENTSRGGISVAQGGRLIAVSANFTGQPGGEGVLVLNQTAGFVAQIPGPFYRQYLERDTVDVFVSPTADSSFPDPGRIVITRGRTGVVHDFDLLAITSPDPQTQGTRIARIDVAPSGQYAAIQGLYFGTLPDAGPRVYIVPLVPGAPAIQVGNRDRTPSAPCQNSLTGALGPLWSHDSRRLSTAFSTQTRNAPQTLPMWINTCTVWSTFNLLSDSGSVVFAADTGSVAFQGTAIFAHRLTGDDRFMITTEMNVGGFNNSPLGPCDIVLRNALTPALFSLTLRPGAPNECNATLKTVPVISNTVAPEVVSPANPSEREL